MDRSDITLRIVALVLRDRGTAAYVVGYLGAGSSLEVLQEALEAAEEFHQEWSKPAPPDDRLARLRNERFPQP